MEPEPFDPNFQVYLNYTKAYAKSFKLQSVNASDGPMTRVRIDDSRWEWTDLDLKFQGLTF